MNGLDRVEFSTEDRRTGTAWRVVIEVYARVAYAYLVDGESIVTDVWLYNRFPAPSTSEWSSKANMPFMNADSFAASEPFAPIASASDVEVDWGRSDADSCRVDIRLHGVTHARLEERIVPGWCRLALRDGPCARVLPDG